MSPRARVVDSGDANGRSQVDVPTAASSQPCEIHEMPWCGICAGHDKKIKPRATGPTIAAVYAGLCACCGEGFANGTSITRSEDAGGWCITSHTDQEQGHLP